MVRKDVIVETKGVIVELQASPVGVRRRRRRRAGAAASCGVLSVVLVGCSGVDPGDQREGMLAASGTIAEALTSLGRVESMTVLDEGTEAVSCASGGSRYQYVAYGWSNWAPEDPVDDRLDNLTGAARAGVYDTRDGSESYFTGAEEIGSAAVDGDGPRQVSWWVEDGPDAGVSVTVDAVHQTDGVILVRLAGTTACG